MKNFLNESVEEFKAVVWPTQKETKTYLRYNIVVIIAATIFLMAIGSLLRSGLGILREAFYDPSTASQVSTPTDDLATREDLDALIKKMNISTGSTNTGAVENTGATSTGTITVTGSTMTLSGSETPLQIEVNPAQ